MLKRVLHNGGWNTNLQSMKHLTISMHVWSHHKVEPFLSVLILAGVEVIFFAVVGVGPCFGFVLNTEFIT